MHTHSLSANHQPVPETPRSFLFGSLPAPKTGPPLPAASSTLSWSLSTWTPPWSCWDRSSVLLLFSPPWTDSYVVAVCDPGGWAPCAPDIPMNYDLRWSSNLPMKWRPLIYIYLLNFALVIWGYFVCVCCVCVCVYIGSESRGDRVYWFSNFSWWHLNWLFLRHLLGCVATMHALLPVSLEPQTSLMQATTSFSWEKHAWWSNYAHVGPYQCTILL